MKEKVKNSIRFGILALVLLVLLPFFSYLPASFDNDYWQLWCSYIYNHGLGHTYDSGANYLPFYPYILWIYVKLQGSWQAVAQNLNYLRVFTLVFDIAGLWFVYKWVDRKVSFLLLCFIGLLNIAYSYNTILFGR